MKVQIIQLDSHDDVISTRDKMAWGKTARLILVWPEDSRILERKLDLVLLQRVSQTNGSQLGLVCKDETVISNAGELRIPVFASVTKAQSGRWRKKRTLLPGIKRQTLPIDFRKKRDDLTIQPLLNIKEDSWIRLAIFGMGILSILALLVVFLPGANINLIPQSKQQSMTIDTVARMDEKTPVFSSELPAHSLSIIVEGQEQTSVRTTAWIPFGYASGEVEFTNLTEERVIIPQGIIVLSPDQPDVKYEITRSGEIEAGSGKTLILPVRALSPGEQGNTTPGTVQAIEGSLGLQVKVNNPGSLKGGTSQVGLVVGVDDVNTLRQAIQQSLETQALAELAARIQPGDKLLPDTLKLKNILEEKSEPAIGQAADQFSITLRAEYSVVYLSGNEINQLGKTTLEAHMPDRYEAIDHTLTVEIKNSGKMGADNTIPVTLGIGQKIQNRPTAGEVADLVRGQNPSSASQRLVNNLDLAVAPRIKLSPRWWPWIPFVEFRIAVVVQPG
jgi:hypothetical protein